MFWANCELTLTENSMPTLRSSPDRSLGSILVPNRFQTSGVPYRQGEALFSEWPDLVWDRLPVQASARVLDLDLVRALVAAV